MTTEASGFRIDEAANLFVPNDCINLPRLENADIEPRLACITVSQVAERQGHGDVMWACAERAGRSFLSGIETWTCWLFACVCGEDNRVTRHRGLWNLFAKRGVAATAQVTPEAILAKDGGLYIYGAMGTGVGGMRAFRPVVGPGTRSFVALLPRTESLSVELAIAMGWQRGLSDLGELRDLALIISKQRGVLFRFFGEFDDREAGVDCIMGEDTFRAATALPTNL